MKTHAAAMHKHKKPTTTEKFKIQRTNFCERDSGSGVAGRGAAKRTRGSLGAENLENIRTEWGACEEENSIRGGACEESI